MAHPTALRLVPSRSIAKELACVAWPPRKALEQGPLFTLLDAPGTGCHVTRWGPWQQGPHRVQLAVDSRIRLQHLDELRMVRP